MAKREDFLYLKASLSQSRWFDARWMSFHDGEGTRPIGCFGLLSGPDYQAYTFYHELAHAMIAVLDEQPWRLQRYNFGLEYTTKVEVFDREYDEPVTDNAIHQELRVIALQLWLMQMDQGKWDSKRLNAFLAFHVGALETMTDFVMFKSKLLRAGKIRPASEASGQDQAAVSIMIDYCVTYAEAFNRERVEALHAVCCHEAMKLKTESDVPTLEA